MGTFSEMDGATACDLCGVGRYCPNVGTAFDEVAYCPPGTYNPIPGAINASACIACAAGKANQYSGMGDAVACIDCEVNTFSSQPGAEWCAECRPGTFQSHTGTTACELCRPGSYCDGHESGPQPCPIGTWSGDRGLEDRQACQECPRGFYCYEGTTIPQRKQHPQR